MPDAHTTWIKPSAATLKYFDKLIPADDSVTRKSMFGVPAAFVNGNLFAWVHQDHIALRLPAEQRASLEGSGVVEPVDPSGRRMREYVQILPEAITNTAQATALAQDAFNYAASLPPKIKKP